MDNGLINTPDGLACLYDGQEIRGDFTKMIKRLTHANLTHELLVKACRIKSIDRPLNIVDATAGLGEDSLLLAASGNYVRMYERDERVYLLLEDTLNRARENASLASIIARMELVKGDSIEALKSLDYTPDIVYLDPMFPKRQKSGQVKKKFQVIHNLVPPATDGEELLKAAMAANPKRIVIKRPGNGEFLAGVKPSYSIEGNSIRYDCIVL